MPVDHDQWARYGDGGYNGQTTVDVQHHMIAAHEVTNVGHDRTQLTMMATAAREAIGHQEMTALDRGYAPPTGPHRPASIAQLIHLQGLGRSALESLTGQRPAERRLQRATY